MMSVLSVRKRNGIRGAAVTDSGWFVAGSQRGQFGKGERKLRVINPYLLRILGMVQRDLPELN
jgi:hypothetical protein